MTIVIASGMRLTPARLNALAPVTYRKTADQSVTNSTALVTDSQLSIPCLANAEYDVEAKIIYEAPTANDMRIAFGFPTGAVMPWGMLALDIGATGLSADLRPTAFGNPASSQQFSVGGGGAGNQLMVIMKGTLIMSGFTGNVEFRFAQLVAGVGTAAIVKAGSTLQIQRIS